MLTAIISIGAALVIIVAISYFMWTYSDYVITAWYWCVDAYNALIATVPSWAIVIFGAALFLAFLGLLVRLL